MTNNVPEMLWQTFAFVIQFYIAALTLGTILNYLVRIYFSLFFILSLASTFT